MRGHMHSQASANSFTNETESGERGRFSEKWSEFSQFSTTRIAASARGSTSPEHNRRTFLGFASSSGLLLLAGAGRRSSSVAPGEVAVTRQLVAAAARATDDGTVRGLGT